MFVIIGTVTADLLVLSDSPITESGEDGFTNSNLFFTEEPLKITMGGNGGNSAYVSASLGIPTALCGAVGSDLLGEHLIKLLKSKDINLEGLNRSVTHATSSSTIIMSGPENQTVFHHLGSTAQAAFEDTPIELFSNADVLLASSYPIMPNFRREGYAKALAITSSSGGITALDIGPAIGEPVTLKELAPLFPAIHYLMANTHELIALTGEADWTSAAEKTLAAGARNVVVKQGESGASVWNASERVSAPGLDIEPNISVGAGDSFNVGFLYGVQQNWRIKRALRFGNALAAMIVSGPAGILGAPALAEVKAFLKANPLQ